MSRPAFVLISVFAAIRLGVDAAAPAEEANVTISTVSFEDIVVDVARTAEQIALKGKNRSTVSAAALAELPLVIPSKVFRLWMDIVPALEANGDAGFKAPTMFPPGLDEAISKVQEATVPAARIFEMISQLKTVAAKVAKPAENAEGPKTVSVPKAWVEAFLIERQALAMKAMEESEINGGRKAIDDRGDAGKFAEVGGMKFHEQISEGGVPEAGPVYCARFGKGGTWNLYQVINKPGTWLECNAAAEKLPMPLGGKKPEVAGHLVSLHSEDENAFVVEIARGISYFWIGLNDRRLEAGNDPEGPWEWSSGEPVTWRNWFGKEPDSGGPRNPTEEFDSRTDEDGVVCGGTLVPFIAGRWKDYPTGTSYAKNRRASYVVEWNVNAAEPIPGAKQLPKDAK